MKNPVIMVIGVSGIGKSTIAEGIALELKGFYLDADDYHPARNVRSMEAGIPLNDTMRWPWLAAVAEESVRQRINQPVIIACSALKKSYRDFLRSRIETLQILNPVGTTTLIEQRMNARENHYMPAGLLKSQLDTFEPPSTAINIDINNTPEAIIKDALSKLTF